MTPHRWLDSLLLTMPAVEVRRARLWQLGRYSQRRAAIDIRHGLRGPSYFSALAHEAIHAERGDRPCATREMEARQELAVAKEAARRLIDVCYLADVAVAHPDDPHMVAELLDVDYETLATRVRWLHPAERHYLRRRMAARDGEDTG